MASELRRWEDEPPAFPPRSVLVRPAPIALGTPDAESLSSYIARLSEHHGLWPGKLAQLLVQPRLRHPTTDALRARFAGRTPALGGSRGETRDWVEALADLTRRDDLEATTLLPLAGIVAWTGLMRRGAVCVECLIERKAAGLVFESLAWLVMPATLCPRHETPLLMRCPRCGWDLVALAWRSRRGHCPRCGTFLGEPVASTSKPPRERDLWISNEVGRLVAALPDLAAPPLAVPTSAGIVQMALDAGGGSSLFRQELGLPATRMSNWARGAAHPELSVLLEITRVAGLDLPALMRGAGPAARVDAPPTVLRWERPLRRRFDWAAIGQRFLEEARSAEPSPVMAFCRRLAIDPPFARRRIPVEFAALKAASRAYRRARGDARRAELLAVVEKAVSEVAEAGGRPARRAIEARLPKGVSLRERALGDRWRELRDAA